MSQDETPPDIDLKCDTIPPTPPTPDAFDADGSDVKSSRKREREVSIEPATPRTEELAPESKPIPATKKNRVQLDSTAEEPETPPPSPKKSASPVEMSRSPPHETKVQLIRERVRGLNWNDESTQLDDFAPPSRTASIGATLEAAFSQAEIPVETQIEPIEADPTSADSTSAEIQVDASHASDDLRPASESDSDDQEKKLKRKLADRAVSTGVETTKRARDDPEDDNPRDKKRPTPPPEEPAPGVDVDTPEPTPIVAEVAPVEEPKPKVGGFLSYASPASPFAQAKGPPVIGVTSASPFTQLKGPIIGNISAASPSFASGNGHALPAAPFPPSSPSLSTAIILKDNSLTGMKRTGFQAFAASSSPFASVARSKSPTGFGSRSGPSASLHRSKSPPRSTRALGAISAFSAYTGSASPFVTPALKKQRQEGGSGSDGTEGEKDTRRQSITRNGSSTDASEDESDRQTSFGERLRAGKSDEDVGAGGSEEDEARVAVSAQDLHTGEENDDTLFQVRCKVYKLSEQNQWQERGTGTLKLNVRKSDGGGARLLMRKEAVFTLLLNATLFKGMRCVLAQDPRYVRFSSIEAGHTVHYNLRLSNAKVAAELLEEINANIPGDESEPAV